MTVVSFFEALEGVSDLTVASIMSASVISSALSTAPDDVIEPSSFSEDLPPSSTPSIASSADECVGLDLSRLPGYEKVPFSKRSRSSWTWEHGYELIRSSDGTRVWVCRICHRMKVSNAVKPYIYKGTCTTHAASHMKRQHPDVSNVRSRREKSSTSIIEQLQRSTVVKESTLIAPFSSK